MDAHPENLTYDNVDFCDPHVMVRPPYRHRRTTIITEIVDNNISTVDIQKMLEGGMNVAELSTSYTSYEDKIRVLAKVDRAAAQCCSKYHDAEWPVATCVTLRTCIQRTGMLEDDVEAYLEEGSEVILSTNVINYNKCNKKLIYVNNSYFAKDIRTGMEISLNEGAIQLECTEVVDNVTVKSVVTKPGRLGNMVYVSVRGMRHSRPYITDKDVEIIKFSMQFHVDMIVINYVRHSDTIKLTKKAIGSEVKRPVIICGISTEQGLEGIDDILKDCDGILLPRQFLHYEVSKPYQYRLPQIQKWMAAKCRQARKPFFISGGVLEEFITTGVRKANEVSDIANALMDGVSGFVLHKCHNVDQSIEAIHLISDICRQVEPLCYNISDLRRLSDEMKIPTNAADAAVIACAVVAEQAKAKMIVLPTVSGRTAKALLHLRPNCFVITVSTKYSVTRLLSVYRSIVPLKYSGPPQKHFHRNIEMRVEFALLYAIKRVWVEYGDPYVTLERGSDTSSFCDKIRVCYVDIAKQHAVECSDSEDEEKKRKKGFLDKEATT